MSYIRSGSNPEKLYIWGDGDNVTIAEGSLPAWNIPKLDFHSLLRKYERRFHDCPCEYRGIEVTEVWVDEECKIKLSYKYHSVIMWDVTWEFIVNGFINKNKK
jgi:hypothetical protein